MATKKTEEPEAVTEEPEAVTEDTETVEGEQTKMSRANNTLHNYMVASAGFGLIPIPVVDVAAFIGANVMLVKRLCEIYDVPFKSNIAKSALTGIGGAVGSLGLAGGLGLSVGKLIPGAGMAAGMLTLPIANTAFTYAVGKIFIAHFEMGGTLLDFNTKDYSGKLAELYKTGKEKAKSLVRRKDKEEDSVASEPQAMAS
ncbi:YcjF family protein [Nisaea nitritireducens]|uniref:YcjF family protein n=1 Tax=Nisaea nitritireducens TaxID=568392 RepID=UPI00186953E7|nr:DUF697 domain-containing protein [Nisaea nitritireducens]